MKAAKIVGKAAGIIVDIVIVLCLAFVAAIILGVKPFVIQSGSMMPTFDTGAVAFVNTRADYNSVKADDIIVYRHGGMEVIHRCIGVYPEGLETQGDANEVSDGIAADRSNFMGKYVFHIERVGFFISWVQTRPAMIVCGTAIVALIIVSFAFGKSDKEGKEEAGSGGGKDGEKPKEAETE